MSETWRPLAIILFRRPSNYVQNAVEKSKIVPVVFEVQSAPYCKLALCSLRSWAMFCSAQSFVNIERFCVFRLK